MSSFVFVESCFLYSMADLAVVVDLMEGAKRVSMTRDRDHSVIAITEVVTKDARGQTCHHRGAGRFVRVGRADRDVVGVDDMDADDRGHSRIGGDGRKVRHRARQVARLVVQHG